MDKLTTAVLAIVNAQTGGSYKVLETKDFVDALPEKLRTDGTGISNALSYLAERGFIDIRYAERDTYCVCSLPKGRTVEESVSAERGRGKRETRGKILLSFLFGFAGAFLGAFLAGILLMYL